MRKKKFKILGIVSVFFLSFLSCDVNLLGGPFTEVNPENEDNEDYEFERGFRVWIDGPSFYERGLLRVIVEDFGDGSMLAKGDEELKTRTKGYFTSKSGGDGLEYPVIWDFDWYAKPLRKGRMVFEPAISTGQGGSALFLSSGYNNTIGFRLMIPLDESVFEYDAVRATTSGVSGLHDAQSNRQDHTVFRTDFKTDVDPRLDSQNYLRIDTVNGQKRADVIFTGKIFPSYIRSTFGDLLPASLRPIIHVLDSVGEGQPVISFLLRLIFVNAFGFPASGHSDPNLHGNLNFSFLDASSVVGSYSLSEEQVLYLRNIFIGFNESSDPPSVLFQAYNDRQSYEIGTQVLDGITYQTASVRRSGPNGKSCSYRAMVAGLSTTSDETDDELRLEVDRCLIGPVTHANTWDQVLDDIFSIQMLVNIDANKTGYHMTRAMIKEANINQAFDIRENQYIVHFKYPWLAGVSGQATLRAMMRVFGKGNLLEITGNGTDITGNTEASVGPNTLGIALQPSRDEMLDTRTRKGLVALWWPISELNKIRNAFNP